MSTATAEKAKSEKPSVPLGSFLGKLTPKPAEKVTETPIETKEAPHGNTTDTTAHDSGTADESHHQKPPTVAAVPPQATGKTEVATDDKPKEEVVEKRLKDTQRSWHEEHKARLAAEQREVELQARLQRIEAKLDGTYTEPALPTSEQIATDADVKGRIRASHHAAVRQHGEQFVMETVWNQDSPYMELQAKSPRIRERVMTAEDPVLEAIAVVKEHQDAQKYGRTPDEIRKKLEAELAPKLKQEILEGLKVKPGPATNTLGNVRGDSARTEQKSEASDRLDFRKVFPWGASRT